MNLQRHSERTDSRRKPKHPRLELRRKRRREDRVFENDHLDIYQRPGKCCH